MRFTRYALPALALVMVIGCGQRQDTLLSPEVTEQCKPWTRWWWPGSAFQPSDIDCALSQYSEAGLGSRGRYFTMPMLRLVLERVGDQMATLLQQTIR